MISVTWNAIGVVEITGYANTVVTMDSMLKAADVEYVTKDTKCGGHALVFMGGSISAVTAAVESVKENPPCRISQSAVLSNPSQEMVDIVEMFRNR